jgi:hypothetical protein
MSNAEKTELELAAERLTAAFEASARARVSTTEIQNEYAQAGYAFFEAYRRANPQSIDYKAPSDEYARLQAEARKRVEDELVAGGFIEVVEPPAGAKYGRYWNILQEWS